MSVSAGYEFEVLAQQLAGTYFSTDFREEQPLLVGNPPKAHRFDLVSTDGSIVVECKNYRWTSGGSVPSAKLSTLNEAVLYMSFLPATVRAFVAVPYSQRKLGAESLGEYYSRVHGHLLRNVRILEIDLSTRIVREIQQPT